MAQPGGLKLGPGNGFEISGGHAENFALGMKLLQEPLHRGAELGIELGAIALDFAAHKGEGDGQFAVKIFGFAFALRRRAQNAGIGIAMDGNVFQATLDAKDITQGDAKGEVVNGVAAVEQGSVDIENVSGAG